ncbi:MAG: hypothetical protein E6J01_04045 [Chloroflexi bacterium]|nr:MAG: hypothetical protein E6J01_04045 [Chloroflexota bacterium]
MSLPTREEIAEIVRAGVRLHTPRGEYYALEIADALLARLRPASPLEDLVHEVHGKDIVQLRKIADDAILDANISLDQIMRLKQGLADAAYVAEHRARECDALRADYKETRAELQRVLGLLMDQDERVDALRADLERATEHANHYSERVGKLGLELETAQANLRACAEALADLVDRPMAWVDGDANQRKIKHEFHEALSRARAALARPGVQEART